MLHENMNEFKEIVAYVAYGIEAVGVMVIVIGSVVGTVRLLPQLKTRAMSEIYHEYRQVIGRSILLGLEFLIAGDVIRTVIVSHTLTDVAALALMVLVRAFLSLTLTVEIEGKLPCGASAASEVCRRNPDLTKLIARMLRQRTGWAQYQNPA